MPQPVLTETRLHQRRSTRSGDARLRVQGAVRPSCRASGDSDVVARGGVALFARPEDRRST